MIILDLIHGVLPYIQMVVRALILQGLVLRRTLDTVLLEVLRFHQLLIRLRMRLHVDGVLNEVELPVTSLFLDVVLACGCW